ncbi:Crp/Fnr family transcriptional regulator [Amycolatopsis anabasis]|uniref:Crp/Fnr family transcriptional regulator n=1 Tax=Amycolatopsis anabasis TaxID=1840409 RepID=UPI00131C6A44|nr:Crp/Fnr family transcriptional regulator [Amycolatopsis anabasis]
MGLGLIEEATKWRRRGLSEPWLEDSFVAELPPDSLRRLERHASLLDAGQLDGIPGAAGAPVVIVLDGAVKVFQVRWDGPNVLVDVAGPGDVLNAEEIVTGVATAVRFGQSGKVVLLSVPRRKFRELLDCDQEMERALCRTFARRLQAQMNQRSHTGRKVEQRLWAFLVELGRRHGTPANRGGTLLRVGLTQADLAAALGVSRNSVETARRNLREAGKLSTGYAQAVLHELPSEEELDQAFWNWA